MKKRSTSKDDLGIPVLTREQLGRSVRCKYLKRFSQGRESSFRGEL
jgi:hypothetical protein